MSKIKYLVEQAAPLNQLQEIAPRIYWLRLAMPFALDHINLWLIEDENFWTVVDTGPDVEQARESWLNIINEQLKGKPIKLVLCTHFHPDHLGLAGWLCEEFDAQLLISKGEYDIYHHLFSELSHTERGDIEAFYQSIGASDKQMASYEKHITMFGKIIHPLPKHYQPLADKQKLNIGGYNWLLVTGKGHSPEHICLYNQELDLFISGDQLLPTISSNVSVWPTEPLANPMQDMLDSYQYLLATINDNTKILPAHGLPFTGGIIRTNKLINDTEQDIKNLLAHCQQPSKLADTFPVLFKSQITKHNLMLAYGEALACINYLIEQDKLVINVVDGVNHYQAV
ncbi:MBL fold metallo-hydrolase [Thalassomonas sp. M1454]|uniref:MBL fold metallo-hydrolase n=1 Tax=Thalassomonas sp. M1454 TaxID=2594477 RepID=UPI0011804CB9|nr:MBL fold metallo-hydrolase [Thalassomonas sp. M1454]TRX56528.1 MBL fold metallo-hydrolase [Thalassomonas sp. M1454]